MRAYTITVNGKSYDVEVKERETDGSAEITRAVAAPSAPQPAAARTAAAAPAPQSAPAEGPGIIKAPMVGKIMSIPVKEGSAVKAGQILLTFEAMKMENEIMAPRDGTVSRIFVSVGSEIEAGTPLVQIG